MKRIFNYHITHDTMNILDFLKSLGYSRVIITSLKKTTHGILKNGIWARVSEPLTIGDILTITLTEEQSSEHIIPIAFPLDVVYEDEDLMIINKPSNMPIHPSQGNYDNTLANAVAYYFQTKGETFVYRCINRLDRDTTGLLILAKHAYSASLLSTMVANRQIHREYLAIVTGDISPSGTIDAPIGRLPGSTIERCIDYHAGDRAITHWGQVDCQLGTGAMCIAPVPNYKLVSVTLETGRTHQIRVHMKHIGHPLPGDFLYNPDYKKITRQALHSHKLSFIHPITKKPLIFSAPLPDDMKRCLQ